MAASAELGYENTKSNESSVTKSNQTKNTDATFNNTTDASQNTVINSGSTNSTVVGGRDTTSTTYNSGSVNTSQLMLTPEAVTHMINQILEGTSGLASTVGGQKGAGIYNDTATKLLTDDLLVRTAGEVAAKSAVTRTVIGSSTSSTVNRDSGYTSTENIGSSTSTQNIGATKTTGSAKTMEDIILVAEGKKEAESTTQSAKVKVGWILCTELYKQGRMPLKYYTYGSREFAKYDVQSKKGYYIWAVPALKHLKAHPYSLRSRVMCTLLNARAEYISAEGGCRGARKTLLGAFAKNLYWGCWILSRTVARNYNMHQVIDVIMEDMHHARVN